jgi:hypothetical protein
VPRQSTHHRRGARRPQGLPPAGSSRFPRRFPVSRRRMDQGTEDPRCAAEKEQVRPGGPGHDLGRPGMGHPAHPVRRGRARPTADRADRRCDPDDLRRRRGRRRAAAAVLSARRRGRGAGHPRSGAARDRTHAVPERGPRRPVVLQPAALARAGHRDRPPAGRKNRHARSFLHRDVERVCEWAEGFGVRSPAGRITADMWTSWEFADLVPEELRGLTM